MLSSLAQLAESASNHISSAPPDSTSAAANKATEQLRRYYIRMLHNVLNEADDILLMVDACDPAWCHSRLVAVEEEEVCKCKAEGKVSQSHFCCSTNWCVSPILSPLPLHLVIIDIRPYYCNVL